MKQYKKKLKILVVADPLENFNPQRETSLWIMEAAQKRGHQIYASEPQSLSALGKELFAHAQKLNILGIGKNSWWKVLASERVSLKNFDAILLRKDPPFDLAYLRHLELLDLLSEQVFMMNHPRGILLANEKIFPLRYPDLIPDTLISARYDELHDFVRRHPQGVIVKPIGSSGGRGIFWVPSLKSPNLKVILETATEEFSRHVIAQAYVPEIKKGDKRIMLLGEQCLGAFIRRPGAGEHRANLHAGGSFRPVKMTKRDQEIVKTLIPDLLALGLHFVGLDLIGDYLTEVNVTSPMGIAELGDVGVNGTAGLIVDYLEEQVMHKC